MTRQAIPYRFEKTHGIRELRRLHATLGPGSRARGTVRIAGRVLRRRDHGALTFIDLADETGTIQLWIDGQAADAQGLTSYPSGTWVGIEGEAAVTRRGELSVRVRTWTLLALCDRRVPDRRYAPTDPDAQMRERYADLWARPEARDVLRRRFEMTAMLRADLARRGYLEVETPILHHVKGGAVARPFKTHHEALDTELTLRIAPELDLKRLVVAGFERVFEIGRVFRNEGLSPRHNPEFTSLEVYAAYADYGDMMSLTEGLVSTVATMLNGAQHAFVHDQRIDLTPPWPRVTMHGLVGTLLGEEITSATPVDRLRLHADRLGVHVPVDAGAGRVVAEIYEQRLERTLTGPIFVCDYPREVSPLARRHRNDPLLAERFEVVVAGMELANAYSELQDADDQEAQLLQQAARHEAGDDEAMSHDAEYVRALRFGLPPTGGLGIGIDRLAMLLTNSDSIRDVLAFPTLRPAAAQVIDNRNGGAARAATRTAPARTTPEPVTPVTTSTRRGSP